MVLMFGFLVAGAVLFAQEPAQQTPETDVAAVALDSLLAQPGLHASYRIDVDLPGDADNWEEGEAIVKREGNFLYKKSEGAGNKKIQVFRMGAVVMMEDPRRPGKYYSSEKMGKEDPTAGLGNPMKAIELLRHAMVKSAPTGQMNVVDGVEIHAHAIELDLGRATKKLEEMNVIEDGALDATSTELKPILWLDPQGMPHSFNLTGTVQPAASEGNPEPESSSIIMAVRILKVGDDLPVPEIPERVQKAFDSAGK
jgi:hypothetical protein